MSLRRIFALVVVLMLVAVLIGAASRSQTPETPAKRNPAVTNNTDSFEVIAADLTTERVFLAFRNDYDKTIMAYVVSCGDKNVSRKFTEDFAYSDLVVVGIPPHTVYEQSLSLCGSAGKQANDPVVIEAVVFEDGTGNGDPAVVQSVQDEHLGSMIQLERTLKLLDDYLIVSGKRAKGGIGELKSQILSKLDAPEADSIAALRELQPARESTVLSEPIQAGLETRKEDVTRRLQDAEAAQDIRAELVSLKKRYERILRRL